MTAPERRLVVLEWLDAHTLGQEEVPAEDAVAQVHRGYRTTTAGFLVRSDAVGVTLTTDVQTDEDGVSFRHLHFVPRGMIVSEQAFPQPRKRAGGDRG